MSHAVGADIESICRKCGDVWHVVVAKVEERIAKVQCKQCNGVHRYKSPADAAKAGASARGTSSARPRRASKAPEPELPEVEADTSRPIRRYLASDAFEPGDRVEHPTFGAGVVQRSPGPGRVEILFPSGAKLLAQAKPASTLTRTPRVMPDATE